MEFPKTEVPIIEGVGEGWLALIALPDVDLGISGLAGLDCEADVFEGVQGKGVLVVEGQHDQLLVVDADRDHVGLVDGVSKHDLEVVLLREREEEGWVHRLLPHLGHG